MSRRAMAVTGAFGALVHGTLLWLGRSYGSTSTERAMELPGDDIVPVPQVVTDHAITIDAGPDLVWPWLVQMGWHRGGWYTARWVDRLLFPENWPSAAEVIPELQDLAVGDFIPDGAPRTGCGFIVQEIDQGQALVLRSTSHLPARWRSARAVSVDWSWSFVLRPVAGGHRTRFHFRSRWRTAPWWMTVGSRLVVVPADFVMSRDMLHGVKRRAELLALTAREEVLGPVIGDLPALTATPSTPPGSSSRTEPFHRPIRWNPIRKETS